MCTRLVYIPACIAKRATLVHPRGGSSWKGRRSKQTNRGTAEIDVRFVPEGVNRSRSGPIELDEYWVTGATAFACTRSSRRTALQHMPIRNETKESEAAVTDRVAPKIETIRGARKRSRAREPTRHSADLMRRTQAALGDDVTGKRLGWRSVI